MFKHLRNASSSVPLYGTMGGWGQRKGPEYYSDVSRAAFSAGRPGNAELLLRRAVATALPGSGKRRGRGRFWGCCC